MWCDHPFSLTWATTVSMQRMPLFTPQYTGGSFR